MYWEAFVSNHYVHTKTNTFFPDNDKIYDYDILEDYTEPGLDRVHNVKENGAMNVYMNETQHEYANTEKTATSAL